jgi:hypothetical protein
MKIKYRIFWSVVICVLFAAYLNVLAYIVNTKTEPVEEIGIDVYHNTMKPSDAESVMAIISAEGFDNTFNHQSTFRDIGDHKFHELRKAYVAASRELMDYIAESAGKVNNIPYYMAYEDRN